jgi:serine/threonine-protein kinase HipA
MGRDLKTQSLGVWMNGIAVGEWSFSREHKFRYYPEWLASKKRRPLSLSMPLTTLPFKGSSVEFYFDNLLPDAEEIRQRLRSRFSLSSKSAFALLSEIGRDCIGALQLLPPGVESKNIKSIKGIPADDKTISTLLKSSSTGLLRNAYREDFRISLAGSQEKTAFLKHNDRWMVPEGATPTTHIFKLPLGRIGNGDIDLSTSVENEWLCSRILKQFGIETAKCSIKQFEAEKVLIVERFDRRLSDDGSWIIRIPQEDFCQARGISSALKYESDGGPGIKEIMDVLRASVQADDRKTFFKTQIIFFLLAATDGHAKNFSIYLLPEGRFKLTPVYDVLSLFPVLGNASDEVHPKRAKMAMAFYGENGKTYNWNQICRRHLFATAKAVGLTEEICTDLLNEILESLPFVINKVLQEMPDGFPMTVSTKILGGLKAAAQRLRD